MSDMSAGQIVGGVVGAVVGFFYAGGPVGAVQGFALGAGIGGYIDPPPGPNLRGPTLNDKSFQSSAYGVSLPRLYGTIATMGNIIYLENNEYKAVTRRESQGGKGGGGGATVETTTYFATFAIALSQVVENSSVKRIWAGGKLIYSAGNDGFDYITKHFEPSISNILGLISNPVNPGWRYYDGTQTVPDSRMEAVLGVGQCPSYEGTAYIIFYDFELTDYGNGLAGCPIKVELSGELIEVPYRQILRSHYSMRDDINYYARPMCYFPAHPEGYSACTYGLYGENSNSTSTQIVKPPPDGFVRQVYGGIAQKIITAMPGAEVDIGVDIYSYSYFSEDPLRLHSGVSINGAGYENSYKNYPDLFSLETAVIMRVYYISGAVHLLYKTTGEPVSSSLTPEADKWFFDNLESGSIGFVGGDPGVVAWDGLRLVRVYRTSAYSYRAVVMTAAGVSGPTENIDFTLTFNRVLSYNYSAKIFGNVLYIIPVEGADLATGIVHLITLELSSGEASYHSISIDLLFGAVSFPTLNVVSHGAFQISYRNTINSWGVIKLSKYSTDGDDFCLLASICEDEFNSVGVVDEFRDFTEINSVVVSGYATPGMGSARANLQQLQAAYFFDFVEVGYKIYVKDRAISAASPVVINDKNLCLDGGAVIKSVMDGEAGLPSRYIINYIDREREYDQSSQVADYPAALENQRAESLAIVLSANDAATIADKLINLSWIENRKYSLKLPQPFLDLRESDHIIVLREGMSSLPLRIDSCAKNSDQTININARLSSVLVYDLEGIGASGSSPPQEVITNHGDSQSLLADVPMIDERQDSYGFILASFGGGDSWPGAVLQRSSDGGQNYSAATSFSGVGCIGQALNVLAVNDGLLMDRVSQLTFWPVNNHAPPSHTEEIMMTGKNYLAYGDHGRWEICQYANADLQLDGTYILSAFVRGLRGTEWATGLHKINDWVVLLDDPDNILVGSDSSSIGVERLFKTITIGQNSSDVVAEPFTYGAANLRPLAPVNPVTSRVSNDWNISASERSRYSSSFWNSGLQPQRDNQLFAVDIFKSGLVVRTIQSTALSFTYSSGQQLTDFGALQSNITCDIYQISELVGAGFKMRVIT